MPVRPTYGIRTSLAKSKMDSQIQLGSNTSLSFAKKPLTLASFIYTMFSVFIYAIIYSKSVIMTGGGLIGFLLFTSGYICLFITTVTRTATLNYRLSYLPVYFKYWRRGGRDVKTGLLEPGARLKNFLGIDPKKAIDQDGIVHFTNGEIGIFLDVVGNASSMIFDADQESVIKDARTIYKNLPSRIGLTLITQASEQDVHLQLQSKLDQLHRLQIDSPGLRQVIKKQGQVLRDNVGSHFAMIRQYLFIRGEGEEAQNVVKMLIQAADSSTNNYLKSAEMLTNEKQQMGRDGMPLNEPHQVEKLLASIYNDSQD